ncbi:MAG: hypothetical protein P9M03_01860 [Candidatus Theseobacter exili]|nr:hypothetical protein [Candidatus Theseobacter exili]
MKKQNMKNIQKKPTSKFKHCCSFLLLLFFATSFSLLYAQTNVTEVTMTDTLEYTDFGFHNIANINYPPSNLFDLKVNTCLVSKADNKKSKSFFIRVPNIYNDSIYLNIFSGYGKSKDLYQKNSRPKEINISFYTAFIPEGYVTESHYTCKAFQLPMQQTIYLSDTFGIQQIQLRFSVNDFKAHSTNNLIDTIMLVQLEIADTWKGDKYIDDICISEIFFNDCYASLIKQNNEGEIDTIYLNTEENTLFISKNQNPIEIYKDNESVLQIIQKTNNNEWAIVNTFPREINGRVETTYLILDLLKKEVINQELFNILPDYYPGEPIFLEENNGEIYLVHETATSFIQKIRLIHFFH